MCFLNLICEFFKNFVILNKLQLRFFNLGAICMLLMSAIVIELKSQIQLSKFSVGFARLSKE